jgi:hypothetical protein
LTYDVVPFSVVCTCFGILNSELLSFGQLWSFHDLAPHLAWSQHEGAQSEKEGSSTIDYSPLFWMEPLWFQASVKSPSKNELQSN